MCPHTRLASHHLSKGEAVLWPLHWRPEYYVFKVPAVAIAHSDALLLAAELIDAMLFAAELTDTMLLAAQLTHTLLLLVLL
jgi:hypothetical protein